MRGGWIYLACLALGLCGVSASAIIPTFVRNGVNEARIVRNGPTTRPGEFVAVNAKIGARAYLGFFRDDDRPGDAAKVVRLLKEKPEQTHFGMAVELKLTEDFTGELRYREVLTLPRKPARWDELNASLWAMHVSRELSADGRASAMREVWRYEGGMRVIPIDGLAVENIPTPVVCYDFDAGDPAGTWTMECFLNDVKIASFEFDVVNGEAGDRELVVKPDPVMQKFKPAKVGRLRM